MAKYVLKCDGIQIGNIRLPPFVIGAGEIVGLVIPQDHGDDWHAVMLSLAGVRPSKQIEVCGSGAALMPWPSFVGNAGGVEGTLRELCQRANLSQGAASAVIAGLGLEASVSYTALDIKRRLLLGLRLAAVRSVEHVVFTTSGMAPLSIRAVLAEAERNRVYYGATVLLHKRAIHRNIESGVFDRVVYGLA